MLFKESNIIIIYIVVKIKSRTWVQNFQLLVLPLPEDVQTSNDSLLAIFVGHLGRVVPLEEDLKLAVHFGEQFFKFLVLSLLGQDFLVKDTGTVMCLGFLLGKLCLARFAANLSFRAASKMGDQVTEFPSQSTPNIRTGDPPFRAIGLEVLRDFIVPKYLLLRGTLGTEEGQSG